MSLRYIFALTLDYRSRNFLILITYSQKTRGKGKMVQKLSKIANLATLICKLEGKKQFFFAWVPFFFWTQHL